MLETNYRIYAYTGKHLSYTKPVRLLTSIGLVDNPLQTAILNLFVALKYRFPNLVVGAITRDSVKKALLNGISADQVGSSPSPSFENLTPLLDYQLLDVPCSSSNA